MTSSEASSTAPPCSTTARCETYHRGNPKAGQKNASLTASLSVHTAKPFAGKVFAPVSAVPGVAFVGTDTGTMAALDTHTGRQLWTFRAPAKTACGPSIVDGRVLWGYGFILFAGAGPGGVISFTVKS